jgi:hypothetical protein
MANALKDAVNRHITTKLSLNEEEIKKLGEDVEEIGKLKKSVDDSLLDVKIKMMNSSSQLLLEKIFKDEHNGSLEILKNTRDLTVFYNFLESMDRLLINFNKYKEAYEFNSPDLFEIRETFALKDEQLREIITDICLDNK